MKRQLIVMTAVLMCCTSCLRLNLGDFQKLEPSNNIVKNEYKMEAFSKADIDVVARVKIVQSAADDYRVLLKCPDNYVDLFEFKVEDDELKVGFVKNMRKSLESKDVAIIVCSPTLRKIESEGVASINVDSLRTPSLLIDSEGVGSININGLTTETLEVESSGVGNIELKEKLPSWKHDGSCTCCLSCYHHCPVHAINYGAITRRRGQYYFK